MFSWNQMIVVDSESNSDWRIEDAELEDWLPELIRLHIWTYNCGRAAEKNEKQYFWFYFLPEIGLENTIFNTISFYKMIEISQKFPCRGQKSGFFKKDKLTQKIS